MRAADSTLHWAKAAGGARWALFDPAQPPELARYALSAAIPAALDRGEFFLDYQPLTSLRDGTLLGVEALVRWRHPELGVLQPGQLHRAGRGDRADRPARRLGARRGVPGGGELVGRRRAGAVRQRQPGRPAGEPPGLVQEVRGAAGRTGLPPERLQLEITESTMMSAGAEPVRALRVLNDLGVRIAIDDFGTGYSNLAYLRDLPVTELKMAGEFVTGLRAPQVDPPAVPTSGSWPRWCRWRTRWT